MQSVGVAVPMALCPHSLRMRFHPHDGSTLVPSPSRLSPWRPWLPPSAFPSQFCSLNMVTTPPGSSSSTSTSQAHQKAPATARRDQSLVSSSVAEPEFPQERPESWSRAQRELVAGTVDLGGLQLDVSPARRAQLVEEVRRGAEAGVFYISNLGVDPVLVDQVRRLGKGFFQQPMEEKVKIRAEMPVGFVDNVWFATEFRGYASKYSSASRGPEADEGPFPGFKEFFRSLSYPESDREGNLWPPALPALREKVEQYAEQMQRVVKFVVGLLAEGLGLPASYISDEYGPMITNMVLSNSPPQQLLPGQMPAPSMSAHTDVNLLTLNMCDGVRGLQFFVDGEWLTTPAILDTPLVVLGESIETMSNGKYQAACHRVVSPGAGDPSRLSMLTAVQFGADEILTPAAQLIDAQNPPRYSSRRQDERVRQWKDAYHNSLKPDRSKAPILLDPALHLDKTRNISQQGDRDFLNGMPVLDWGAAL